MSKIKNEALVVEKAVMNGWHRFLHRVITILKSKYTELFIGATMFLSACYEIYEAFQHADKHMGAKHGVALMGILMMIRCIAELLHGAEMMEAAEEREKEKAEEAKMARELADLEAKAKTFAEFQKLEVPDNKDKAQSKPAQKIIKKTKSKAPKA